jgi:kinetochore protein NNF1
LLGAEDLYQAHLAPYLQVAQSTLDSRLEAVQSQNAELAARIQAQRREIESLLSGLEVVVGDLEGAAEAATKFSKENNLRGDTLQIDGELKARQEI